MKLMMTPAVSRLVASLVIAAVLAGCEGDGGSDQGTTSEDATPGLHPIAFSSYSHGSGFEHILTVTEFFGPEGASLNNIVPGTYVARGTYDLTGTAVLQRLGDGSASIALGFMGAQRFGNVQEHSVSAAQPTGAYEVRHEIVEVVETLSSPNVKLTRPVTETHGDHEDIVYLH
jgi:hypothetical protein